MLSIISKNKIASEDIETLECDILTLIQERVEITDQECDVILDALQEALDSIFVDLDYRNYN